MAQFIQILTFVAAIGSGLMAGLYFAFSNSVMSGLARLPASQGIAGMNHINVVIQNPAFLVLFMGTALVALVLAALVFITGVPKPAWIVIGAALYLVGNIAVTIAINVPMNDALAAAAPESAEAARLWSVYLDRWVFWNTIRFVACTGALAAFIVALV